MLDVQLFKKYCILLLLWLENYIMNKPTDALSVKNELIKGYLGYRLLWWYSFD